MAAGPEQADQCCPHLWREAQRQQVTDEDLLAVARAMTPPLATRAGSCRHLDDGVRLRRCPYRAADVLAALTYLRAGAGLNWAELASCFTAGLSAAEARQVLTEPAFGHVTPLLGALTDRPAPVSSGS